MNVELANLAVNGMAALFGGILGGCLVAHKVGRWQQQIEDRLNAAEKRLAKGDAPLDLIPVLDTRLDTVIEELRNLRRELGDDRKQLREDMARMVTRVECERRHET
jgi:hypothetical protein